MTLQRYYYMFKRNNSTRLADRGVRDSRSCPGELSAVLSPRHCMLCLKGHPRVCRFHSSHRLSLTKEIPKLYATHIQCRRCVPSRDLHISRVAKVLVSTDLEREGPIPASRSGTPGGRRPTLDNLLVAFISQRLLLWSMTSDAKVDQSFTRHSNWLEHWTQV